MQTLKRIAATAVCMIAMAVVATAKDRSLAFTTIDFPGAIVTTLSGINAGGEIVGNYRDIAGKTHGFVLSGEQFRSIDVPGALFTAATGINPAGDIVGYYLRPGEPAVNAHGYLLTRRGELRAVDYPGHLNTVPQRILPDGTILGCYHDTDTMSTMHGVVIARDGLEERTEPASMNNGATPNGKFIVGRYTDMMDGRGKGYVVERGVFSPLEVPESTFTAAWDVNPGRNIVGVYRDSGGVFHGFRFDGDQFLSIDAPGATATRAFGINPGGDMVGSFVDASGRTHGFLAQWVR